MQLWLLRPANYDEDDNNPALPDAWKPWYDRCFGIVVAARDEASARFLAAAACYKEGPEPWQDPEQSTCVALEAGEQVRVVMQDVHMA